MGPEGGKVVGRIGGGGYVGWLKRDAKWMKRRNGGQKKCEIEKLKTRQRFFK